jgi:hypothetical protein
MAKNGNKGDNHRQGAIKNRAQAYNPRIKNLLKSIQKMADLLM